MPNLYFILTEPPRVEATVSSKELTKKSGHPPRDGEDLAKKDGHVGKACTEPDIDLTMDLDSQENSLFDGDKSSKQHKKLQLQRKRQRRNRYQVCVMDLLNMFILIVRYGLLSLLI